MADRSAGQSLSSISDGRLRRGQAKRDQILQAALRVIERNGIVGVSQRAVAAEAGVTPTLVVYHFETVENMLSEALIMSHDRYIVEARAAIESGLDSLEALADMIAASADQSRHRAVAEFELLLQSGRNPKIQAVLAEWWQAVEDLIRPVVADADVRRALILAVDGVFTRQVVPGQSLSRTEILNVLRTIAAR